MNPKPLAFALHILACAPMAASTQDPSVHLVRRGETAARIARMHGLTLHRLQALNPGKNLAKLGLSTTLRVSCEPQPHVPSTPIRPEDERRALVALQPLPALPSGVPVPLNHLERLMPVLISNTSAQASSLLPSAASPTTLQSLATSMQPVLDTDGEGELAPNPYTTSTFPFGYDAADPDHLDLLWPVTTRTISSAMGPRIRSRVKIVKSSSTKGKRRIRVRYHGEHQGVDFNAPQGTDVFSVMDGRVVAVARHRQMGYYIVVDHGNGVETLYGHNRRNFVRIGDMVRRGQKIAEVGRTGNASGPHVHFELRVAGARRNPEPYLNDVETIPEEILAENRAAVAPGKGR